MLLVHFCSAGLDTTTRHILENTHTHSVMRCGAVPYIRTDLGAAVSSLTPSVWRTTAWSQLGVLHTVAAAVLFDFLTIFLSLFLFYDFHGAT